MNENNTSALVAQDFNAFGSIQCFEDAQRMAKVFVNSALVPQQFRGDLGSCLIALNMANRMNADPLQVMQSLYVVHGKPSFSASYLIACFNRCGRFSAIRYTYEGERGQDDWGCTASTTELSTGEIINGVTVTMAMAKAEGWVNKNGSKWKTMPELMLRYRAATFLIRSVAPEIALGFQTTEEVRDVIDITPQTEIVPTTLAEIAKQAMQESAESEANEETQENTQEIASNGTLFEDEVTTPNEQ